MQAKKEPKQVSQVKDYKIAFGTRAGQAVLVDMMKAHHMNSPCYVKGDPYETHLREGERNVILRILSMLKIDPQKLGELIRKNEEETNDYV